MPGAMFFPDQTLGFGYGFIIKWVWICMDQYLLMPFLGGWTSIYQLFWCSPRVQDVQGFDILPYSHRRNVYNIAIINNCNNGNFPLEETHMFKLRTLSDISPQPGVAWQHFPISVGDEASESEWPILLWPQSSPIPKDKEEDFPTAWDGVVGWYWRLDCPTNYCI